LLPVAREVAGRDLTLRVGLLYFPAITIVRVAGAAFAVAWGVGRTLWASGTLAAPQG